MGLAVGHELGWSCAGHGLVSAGMAISCSWLCWPSAGLAMGRAGHGLDWPTLGWVSSAGHGLAGLSMLWCMYGLVWPWAGRGVG
jgi:hypothetical protein